MVRIPTNNRHSPQSLPYPITPTSPSNIVFGHEEFEQRIGNSSLGSVSDMSATVGPHGLEYTPGDPETGLPPALRAGHDDPNLWTTGVTPPPRIVPSDLTPRSSSESQRSTAFAPQGQASATGSYQKSTNPYYRKKNSDLGASISAPTKDLNSAAAWADESQKPPFAEPWVEFKIPPEEQALFSGAGTDKSEAELQKSTDAWDNEQRSGYDTDQLTPAPIISYTKELQELEAQPFQSPGETPQRSDAYEKPLPRFPSDRSASNCKEGASAPAPAPKDQIERSEIPPPPPPRPQGHEDTRPDQGNHMGTGTESQQAAVRQQRNETYQIRHVNWSDASSQVNPRRSPIMVQNANGPCPLLALVNALVLSTPADETTALVETLRVREQVSLGLLLDAVIDELMSGRRGDAAQNLPDVSDLYAFLINLHTGMNVNPRFVEPISQHTVPPPGEPVALNPPTAPLPSQQHVAPMSPLALTQIQNHNATSMSTSPSIPRFAGKDTTDDIPTHLMDAPADEPLSPSEEPRKPGGFEDTTYMRLYSTFGIALVHGWLPRRNHPVCDALRRCAETYEDAQSLLFAEEDLENKLQSQGLTIDEQRLLEDIATVKQFLTTSPTQLTDYGLDIITDTLKPGIIAILFRNDHFSTLYKQPRSGRIFTLITDMGYAGHDEVVWESLVDISGEGSEFFSGDFRPVGNNVSGNRRSAGRNSAADDAGWTTVSRSGGRGRPGSSLPTDSHSGRDESTSVTGAFPQLSIADHQDTTKSPNTEQEDHDLALAMQLQEEEEDRERHEAAVRRRREDELSQAYLDSTSRSSQRGVRPQVPPRSGGARRAPPRNQSENTNDAPPPTYEQAAKGPAYHPPAGNPHPGTPSRPNITTTGAQAGRPTRQSSAYSQTNSAFLNSNRPGPAVRRQQEQKEKEKDCIVM